MKIIRDWDEMREKLPDIEIETEVENEIEKEENYPTVKEWIESWSSERFESNDTHMAEEKREGWDYLPVAAKFAHDQIEDRLDSGEKVEMYKAIGKVLAGNTSNEYKPEKKVLPYRFQHDTYELLETEAFQREILGRLENRGIKTQAESSKQTRSKV